MLLWELGTSRSGLQPDLSLGDICEHLSDQFVCLPDLLTPSQESALESLIRER